MKTLNVSVLKPLGPLICTTNIRHSLSLIRTANIRHSLSLISTTIIRHNSSLICTTNVRHSLSLIRPPYIRHSLSLVRTTSIRHSLSLIRTASIRSCANVPHEGKATCGTQSGTRLPLHMRVAHSSPYKRLINCVAWCATGTCNGPKRPIRVGSNTSR